MKSPIPFVHCHVHTDYSLLDGCGRTIEYADMAARLGMPAIAITDHGQLMGIPEHVEACQAKGIKPLVGCEWYVNDNRHDIEGEKQARKARAEAEYFDDPTHKNFHLVTIACDQTGWANLLKLNHDAVRNGYYYRPRTTHEMLCNHAEGMIATTACLGSAFNQAILRGDEREARRLLGQFKDAFGDRFYAEIHLNEIPDQRVVNVELLRLAKDMKIPHIIADDVHYGCAGDVERQDEAIAVAYRTSLDKSFKLEARHLYFASAEQVRAKNQLFGCGLPDRVLEDGLRRTMEIADRCNVNVFPSKITPPKYIDDAGAVVEDAFGRLVRMTHDGLQQMANEGVIPAPGHTLDEYVERAKFELGVIKSKGLADFYLVCWDAAQFCHRRRIYHLVRGSGNSTVVAMAIGLTGVDPIKWRLLFERFLDPDRAEPPDFDIDVSSKRRDEVRRYIIDKYGGPNGERCAPVIAMQTHQMRGAIRSVGKARGVDETILNRLAQAVARLADEHGLMFEHKFGDLVGAERAEATESVIDQMMESGVPKVAEWILENRQLLRDMLYHVGRQRTRSRHAAALAVAPGDLVQYVPIDRVGSGDKAEIVVAWGEGQARQDLSKAGVLKLDILGLAACDIIADTVESIQATTGRDVWPQINTLTLSDDDPVMMAEFQTGAGYGLHEVNTGTERIAGFMGKMQPRHLSDVVALLALYRPGSMEFCDAYVRRMSGTEPVPSIHPLVDHELAETYGIIVYQEQIMMILHNIGGIAKRQAYTVIKAISKKKESVIKAAREEFMAGAASRGVAEADANRIFDTIEKFAGYGFNRAHSTGYALLAGVTAWLRGHFPVQFFTAVLNATKNQKAEAGSTREADEVVRYIKSRGIRLLPITVGRSRGVHTVEAMPDGKLAIRLGMQLIPGVSESVGDALAERGPFANLADVLRACEDCRANVTVLRQLAKAGALDDVCAANRAMVYDVIECWAKQSKTKSQSRTDRAVAALQADPQEWLTTPEVSDARLMVDELEALGFNVRFDPFAVRGRDQTVAKLYAGYHASPFMSGAPGGVVGQLASVKVKKDKNGRTMADLAVVTPEGLQLTAVVFASIWNSPCTKDCTLGESLREGNVYLFRGKRERQNHRMLVGMGVDLPPIVNVDRMTL